MHFKESLKDQLSYMKIISNGFEVDSYPELSSIFKSSKYLNGQYVLEFGGTVGKSRWEFKKYRLLISVGFGGKFALHFS